MHAEQCVEITVYGKVQGVYFRQSTLQKALELGVRGCVRNRRDGSVNILAAGPADAVIALIAWCRTGPALARVYKVDIEPLDHINEQGFSILRDA
ncbi:MAG: acylphosphatase [Saprospiraceae bacterium]|jgi:acylphosphatase|nr:acylphosphatase [Saprospiraceae bacterium]MBP9210055.1 acylphosphatase [Saprospiraceae bacterium]MBV6472902.1 Acylphosphatase [Saprospiraceae bacterium]